MEVLFISPQFFPFILQQQLTVIDFLSYCGGSLGLFLGFSLISAVELAYYFTLRVLCVKIQRNIVEPEESGVSDRVNQKDCMADIMESSTIHGFNQVAKEKRSYFERHVALLVFDSLMTSSIFQILLDCDRSSSDDCGQQHNCQNILSLSKRNGVDEIRRNH
jgi:hypothetical protein